MPRTSYKAAFCERARKLCMLGATNEQLAAAFGVEVGKIHYWLRRYPAFLEATRRGREEADAAVMEALYKRACEGDTTATMQWMKLRQGWKEGTSISPREVTLDKPESMKKLRLMVAKFRPNR